MENPLQITFRHMEGSESVERQIRARVEELDRLDPRIIACHVTVEQDHQRHRQGNLYRVAIELKVPGRVISVGRVLASHHAHEDCHVAIRDGFDAVRRQLEDHVRRARGDVKTHETPQVGRISSIISEQGYGFLVTEAGDEVYVHRNSVVDGGFDRLRVGQHVRYVLSTEPGEKGAHASTVVPIPD